MSEAAPLADAAARVAYADLLGRSPQATVFHGLAHADAVCRVFGLVGEIVLARRASGAVAVGGVVFWKRRGPFRLAVVPPLTPASGPVADADLADALAGSEPLAGADGRGGPLGAWIAHVAGRADAAAFELPPAFLDSRPFVWAGWTARARFTYAGPSECLLADPYVRRMVRENRDVRSDGTSRPGGLRVRWSEDPSDAALVGRFAEAPFRRRGGAAAVGQQDAEAMTRAHLASGTARLAVVEKAGAPVGAVAVLVDRGAGFVWAGAAEPGAGMLMAMAAAAERADVEVLDLVGANLPAVSAFKRRLGLPLVPSVRAEWTRSRLLRLRDVLRG